MAISSKYFAIAVELQGCFRDKDSGLPMRSGYIDFFKDNSRDQGKTVYKISGTPGNYTFTPIGTRVYLTGIGTYSDNDGNDIIPYGLPYESESSNVVELYYVQVFNEDDQPQFTREAWPPNVPSGEVEGAEIVNFVPNGQFALHSNIPADDKHVAGEIRQAITNVAYGGWTFERPGDATSDDFVTFERFDAYTTNPTSSPRYSARVRCSDAGTGVDYKDLRVKWPDVNKFASDVQDYTLSVTAKTNSGSDVPLLFFYVKNYGTGVGVSPQEEKEIGIANLTATYQICNTNFVFGSNTGKTLGTNNDDFTQLAIRYPVDEQCDISITDVVLTIGDVDITLFPITSDADFLYKSLAGGQATPDFNGNDLFLPIIMGQRGYQADRSVIGRVVYESQVETYTDSFHTTTNLVLPDGNSYITSSYSPLGIPMSRLFNKYYQSDVSLPKYGTGVNYVTALDMNVNGGLNTELLITTNTAGSVSATVDGATATGFSISTIHTGATYNTISYIVPTGGFGAGQFYIQNTIVGVATAPDITGASEFTFALGFSNGIVQAGNSLIPQIVGFQPPSSGAAGMTAGHYIKFSTTTTTYYVWWKIGGAGSDPSPGGTGIEVDLDNEDTQFTVGEKIRQALNGWQQTKLVVVAASAIPAGAYFRTFSTTKSYSVWYKKDGSGSAPGVSDEEIEVDILAADTIAQVIAKTVTAINSFQFAVPDYRGLFLRNINGSGTGDPDAIYRHSLVPLISGDEIGTFQNSQNQNHAHPSLPGGGKFMVQFDSAGCQAGNDRREDITTGYDGGSQSNPNNASVNLAIIY